LNDKITQVQEAGILIYGQSLPSFVDNSFWFSFAPQ